MVKKLKALGICLGIIVIAFIPLYIGLLINHFIHPTTFIEKAIVLGFGVYLLGGIQIFFLIIAFYILAAFFIALRK